MPGSHRVDKGGSKVHHRAPCCAKRLELAQAPERGDQNSEGPACVARHGRARSPLLLFCLGLLQLRGATCWLLLVLVARVFSDIDRGQEGATVAARHGDRAGHEIQHDMIHTKIAAPQAMPLRKVCKVAQAGACGDGRLKDGRFELSKFNRH